MAKDIYFFIQQYLYAHPFLVPLGIIGIWRWSVWLFKEMVARKYKPATGKYTTDVSIVSPVYNENSKIFLKALESWEKNNPKEIIAVIDYTDKKCIQVFKKFAEKKRNVKLIITKVPGKRPALALGIRKAKSEIVALVDSDTIWEKSVIKNGLPPFKDRKVAGVGTYQNVLNPKSLAQKIFDIQLDLRYCDEMPFLAASGDALVCLSGRTAFYRRKIITPMLPDLVNETFMGKKVISGDDKRLTYLVLEHGWKVAYQSNSHVFTPGMEDVASYLKQRLRWTRNGIRADLKALRNGWPFKHPTFVFFQIDKFAQAVVVILSPIYFAISVLTGLWEVAAVIFIWWFISRTVKMYPHLKRRPQDILILPAFIIYSFLTAILKIYATFTLNTQGWITRWDKSRLPTLRWMQLVPGYGATIILLIFLGIGVFLIKEHTYFKPLEREGNFLSKALPLVSNAVAQDNVRRGPTVGIDDLRVRKYTVLPNDTIGSIATKFGISSDNLLYANLARLTNWNRIEPGMLLNIPGKGINLRPSSDFNFQRIYDDVLGTTYDEKNNTINVSGRGKEINLSEIAKSYPQYLKEVEPKVWYLTATIFIRSGVTLTLDKKEVGWLRLNSTKGKLATLRANNGNIFITGVKITSWDNNKKDVDRDISDERSYILVKDGSRMDITDSEIAYLGYPRTPDLTVSPYGISWRMSNGKLGTTILTGDVLRSKFHDNYFGAYTFGATGMTWINNEFYNNVRYGLDPHDDSNGFLVEGNIAHDNGSHGIIFSKRCVNNVIRNNISYNNKGHGIMLHEESDNNIVEGNKVYGNTDGIALWHSSSNLIKNNNIYNNKNGIRGNARSFENSLVDNIISGSRQYGVYFYGSSNRNNILENDLRNNNTAVYISSDQNQVVNNKISDNRIGVYFLNEATGNMVLGNDIMYNKKFGVYTKTSDKFRNILGTNKIKLNRKDIAAYIKESTKLENEHPMRLTIKLPSFNIR